MIIFVFIVFLTSVASQSCPPNQWMCEDKYFCISIKWRCDGWIDCYDNSDEINCLVTSLYDSSISSTTINFISSPLRTSTLTSKITATTIKTPTTTTTTTTTTTSTTTTTTSTTTTTTSTTTITTTTTTTTYATKKPTSNTLFTAIPTLASNTTTEKTTTTTNNNNNNNNETFSFSTSKTSFSPTSVFQQTTKNFVSFIDCHFKNSFRCLDNLSCIPINYQCDGVADCWDSSDEASCGNVCSGINEVRCPGDQRCVKISKYCVGFDPCANYLNDYFCSNFTELSFNYTTIPTFNPPTYPCSISEFKCSNKRCIPLSWKCDNKDDCFDLSDELNCNKTLCSPDEFECKKDLNCIKKIYLCNGVSDCRDQSDEEKCTHVTIPFTVIQLKQRDLYWLKKRTCTKYDFVCTGDEKCIPLEWMCDGVIDCLDRSDESFCKGLNTKDCSQTEKTRPVWKCLNSSDCLNPKFQCDSIFTCPDKSDELACACKNGPQNLSLKCSNLECLSIPLWCDGKTQCHDKSDETFCSLMTQKCPLETSHCAPLNKCFPSWYRCNGIVDCPDFSDESDCFCPQTRGFKCSNGEMCLDFGRFCDGVMDCRDFSDEPPLCSSKCAPNLFKCSKSEECILPQTKCDGVFDCQDLSDEQNCNEDSLIGEDVISAENFIFV